MPKLWQRRQWALEAAAARADNERGGAAGGSARTTKTKGLRRFTSAGLGRITGGLEPLPAAPPTFSSLCWEFLEETSSHGLGEVVQPAWIFGRNPRPRRVAWLVLWATAFFCWIVCSWIAIAGFYTFPTVSSVRHSFDTGASFPAVSFCPLAPLVTPKIAAKGIRSSSQLGLREVSEILLGAKTAADRHDGPVLPTLMWKCAFATSLSCHQAYAASATNASDATDATGGGGAGEWSSFVDGEHGLCFTFRPDFLPSAAASDNGDDDLSFVRMPYPEAGLELELLVQPENYPSFVREQGFVVKIHDREEEAPVMAGGIKVRPGVLTEIRLSRETRVQLGAPYIDGSSGAAGCCQLTTWQGYRGCWDQKAVLSGTGYASGLAKDKKDLSSGSQEAVLMLEGMAEATTLNGTYSRSKCVNVCREMTLRKKCGCARDFLARIMQPADVPHNISLCKGLPSDWTAPVGGRLIDCLENLGSTSADYCNEACPVACEESSYPSETVAVDAPSAMEAAVLALASRLCKDDLGLALATFTECSATSAYREFPASMVNELRELTQNKKDGAAGGGGTTTSGTTRSAPGLPPALTTNSSATPPRPPPGGSARCDTQRKCAADEYGIARYCNAANTCSKCPVITDEGRAVTDLFSDCLQLTADELSLISGCGFDAQCCIQTTAATGGAISSNSSCSTAMQSCSKQVQTILTQCPSLDTQKRACFSRLSTGRQKDVRQCFEALEIARATTAMWQPTPECFFLERNDILREVSIIQQVEAELAQANNKLDLLGLAQAIRAELNKVVTVLIRLDRQDDTVESLAKALCGVKIVYSGELEPPFMLLTSAEAIESESTLKTDKVASREYISEAFQTLKQDKAKLAIYFKDFEKTIVEERIEVSSIDLIASLGGTLGLFSGFSVLTFAEFGEFFIGICIWAVWEVLHKFGCVKAQFKKRDRTDLWVSARKINMAAQMAAIARLKSSQKVIALGSTSTGSKEGQKDEEDDSNEDEKQGVFGGEEDDGGGCGDGSGNGAQSPPVGWPESRTLLPPVLPKSSSSTE